MLRSTVRCAWRPQPWGAAYLAGLAVGYWASKEDVLQNWAIDRTFTPEITDEERNKKVRMWKKAVTYSFNWAKED